MRDLLLQAAGVLGLAVALLHGVLGETQVFARARIEPERLRQLLRLVWQSSAIAWAGVAILLIATPSMNSERARLFIVCAAALIYGSAAAANAWATRGRHFGWAALVMVAGLAIAGL